MTHSHNGKVSVAPCGHTGEVIIGTYVRCLVGCEGGPPIPKRGVVGHVLDCACKPCKIRRITTHIVLRDKDGKDWMKVEWDGIKDIIELETDKSGILRGFQFLDADGKIIARGTIEANLFAGKFKLKPTVMVDGIVAGMVAHEGVDQTVNDAMDAAVARIYKVLGIPAGTPNAGVRASGTPIAVAKPTVVNAHPGWSMP